MVDAWKAATPEDFRIAPKVPQVITHERRLQDCAGELAMFLDVMRRLESKLGPLVLQFDVGFRVESLPILAAFLEELPKDIRYAVEIRHRDWLCDEFFQLLEKHEVALILADLYYMPKLDKVFVFANNRIQGHGPATARELLTGLSGILPTS